MLRVLGWLAAAVLLLYLTAMTLAWAFQDRLLHHGWAGPSAAQVAAVPGLTEVAIPGPDGAALRAWYREADAGRPTLILFHGNAGFGWGKLEAFAARGFGLLMTSYRGYAAAPGTPSEAGLLADARAALAWAAAGGLAPEETVLYGESLGTGVAARMALEPGDWRALVLDAPYTSIVDRAAEIYSIFPVRFLLRDRFETDTFIDRIDTPLLILHGTADIVIPVEHGRTLLDLAEEPKRGVWIDGGTHFLPPDRIAAEMADFLAAVD